MARPGREPARRDPARHVLEHRGRGRDGLPRRHAQSTSWIDSIGQGEQGNANFGKNQVPDDGRDPALPHADDKPKPPKAVPKRP
jgi:hypothetical protein